MPPEHNLQAIVHKAVLASALVSAGCGKPPDALRSSQPVDVFAVAPAATPPEPVLVWLGTPFDCEVVSHATEHITPAEPVDYLVQGGRGQGQPVQVMSETGTTCSGASDAEKCKTNFQHVYDTFDATYCVQVCAEHSLAFTRGNVTQKLTKPEDLAAFLAPINTPMEAWLLAAQQVDHLTCGESSWMTQGDHYLVRGKHMVSSCPMTFAERTVAVTAAGEVTVLSSVNGPADGPCIGRLPEGVAMPTLPTEVRAFFSACAELEATSVWAFERMAVELAEAGAPDALVARCHAAASDEVRHAATLSGLAGSVLTTGQAPHYPSRSLEALATENAVEGCVRELVGAAFGLFQAHNAAEPAVRQAMTELGADEVGHAALSFDVHYWLMQQLTPQAVVRVESTMRAAIAGLKATEPACGLTRTGLPDKAQAQVLIEALRPAWTAVLAQAE